MRALIESAELAADPSVRVFDCRHALAEPSKGAELYAAGHIPGALHVHLDKDLSGPKSGLNGRHPLPVVESFARWLGACGVRPDDVVVAYDEGSGMFAARLWWMLRWVGHSRAAVLDGGYAAWLAAGFEADSAVPVFAPTQYVAHPNSGMQVSVAAVEANLAHRRLQLLDARAANRFAGRDETLDPVGGHIPHALNRPYGNNLDGSGRFKPATVLRAEFALVLGQRPPTTVVHQCGSGVTACHNLLAMEVAGLHGSLLYPGSWSEWCSDPSRPIEPARAP